MRIKIVHYETCEHVQRERRPFALLPTSVDGHFVWLERYVVCESMQMRKVFGVQVRTWRVYYRHTLHNNTKCCSDCRYTARFFPEPYSTIGR
jgi:hypothetical protein